MSVKYSISHEQNSTWYSGVSWQQPVEVAMNFHRSHVRRGCLSVA